MFVTWFKLATEIAEANINAQRVVALRLTKLAKGGPAAEREARRMVVEKLAASLEAGAAIANGRSPLSIIKRYGSIVRTNRRRLSR
jgi:hypothetical protein